MMSHARATLSELLSFCVICRNESEVPADFKLLPNLVVIESDYDTNPDGFSFANQRNLAHRIAKARFGPKWIAWLDTDEEMLREGELEAIQGVIKHAPDDVGGFWMGQAGLTCMPVRYGETPQYRVYHQCRIYRWHKEINWEGHAHEQIAHQVEAVGYRITPLPWIISHYGFIGAPSLLTRKLERNVHLIERWLEENNANHELYSFFTERYQRDKQALLKGNEYAAATA